MKITLGFSPCPNDTFIFDALVHHKIDTEGLEFEVVLGDVEELNLKAFKKELDVTKLSYHAYGYLTDEYVLLDSGSALGKGCGKYTTANFLLSIAYPEAINKTEMLFSDIENAVLTGQVEAGLLIHENRFTYEEKGLKKIIDLGEYWEKTIGALIPLGGIVMKRSFDEETIKKVNRLIRKSIEYAYENEGAALAYMQQHAQEMDEQIMMQHVALYVNKYSINLGEEGRAAVTKMFNLAQEKGVIPEIKNALFVV